MTNFFRSLIVPVVTLAVALTAPMAPAAAASDLADTVGQTLIGTMSKVSGDTFAYETARFEEADNTVVLENLTFTREKAKQPSVTIETARILAPVMMENGGFTADSVTTLGIALNGRSVKGTVASAQASNVMVQPADQIVEGAISQWFRYETSSVQNIRIGGTPEAPLVSVATIDTVADINDDNIPVAGEVTVSNVSIQVSDLSESRIQRDIKQLGYEEIGFSLTAKGSYAPEDDTLTVESFQLTGDNVAALSLSASIGGIPESFMASPLDPRTIIATASIGSLDLRIVDDSLTGRVLTAQAKKMGTEPEALAAQLSGALPFFLAVLENDAFQNQVADAVSSFLNEPENFNITMKPEKPTPFIQVFAALTSAPGTIVELLGLSISAND
uniref:hypothetical protein n=1 Tax=Pararhizobium sp. IMCC3301 TaxID=3067904 RepID=UPI00274040A4|nr:hypothetical protein [Pararhizobium sp. IMCC3301]